MYMYESRLLGKPVSKLTGKMYTLAQSDQMPKTGLEPALP